MMARLRDRGHVYRVLGGLRLEAAVAPGDPVESLDGEPLGKITSVAPGTLALAFLKPAFAAAGATYVVRAGARTVTAAYLELPL